MNLPNVVDGLYVYGLSGRERPGDPEKCFAVIVSPPGYGPYARQCNYRPLMKSVFCSRHAAIASKEGVEFIGSAVIATKNGVIFCGRASQ